MQECIDSKTDCLQFSHFLERNQAPHLICSLTISFVALLRRNTE